MSDRPILVISDTHLGFKDETAQRFQHFMTYLTDWVQRGRMTIKIANELSNTMLGGKSLEAPQKIILLGDIIDLWISRDSNTMRPYQESFSPFNSLIALKREIVYLLGNHDGIMKNYEGPHTLPSGIAFTVCHDGYPNERCREGYPRDQKEGDPWKGEQIGNRTYFFLHGHQFDLLFRHPGLLRFGNFMGFSSATAGGFRWFRVLGAVVFLLTVGVVLSPLVTNWLPSLLTLLTFRAQNPWFAVLTLIIGGLVGAVVFLGVLWVFNALARWYYSYSHDSRNTQGENEEISPTLLEKLRRRIGTFDFDRVAPRIEANVIITGHTHLPAIYTPENWPDKLVVNSGSWIAQSDTQHDTFVYVDESGVRLLQWHDDGRYVSQRVSSLE